MERQNTACLSGPTQSRYCNCLQKEGGTHAQRTFLSQLPTRLVRPGHYWCEVRIEEFSIVPNVFSNTVGAGNVQDLGLLNISEICGNDRCCSAGKRTTFDVTMTQVKLLDACFRKTHRPQSHVGRLNVKWRKCTFRCRDPDVVAL